MQTKSLRRLERLRAKLGLLGLIEFKPDAKGIPSRYTLHRYGEATPIGPDAKAARCRLKELAGANQ